MVVGKTQILHALLALLLALLLCGPALFRGELVGSAGAEVYGHAWVQEWVSKQWPSWPLGTDLVPAAKDWPVIDPLPNWITGLLSKGIGLVGAWNLRAIGGLFLAGMGGAALAEAVGGSALVGLVGLETAPILRGSFSSGLTEDFSWGIVAFALAAALRGEWKKSGLYLGLSAFCGLYLAWMGALAVGMVGLWAIWKKQPLLPLLGGGGIALLLTVAAAGPFWGRLQGESHRIQAHEEPLWKLNPWLGSDLLAFWAPGRQEVGAALVRQHPTYLGYSTLALALLAPGPELVGVLACMAVSLGPEVSVMGTPVGLPNPAWRAFQALPLASHWHHHARLMLLGQSLLLIGAARGARGRHKALVGVILAENLLLSPASVLLPSASVEAPPIYARLQELPEGPVVVAGAAGPGIPPQKVFFDQRIHGRELRMDPNRPGWMGSGAKILVALGPAAIDEQARRGPPAILEGDGAAWVLK